MSGAIDTQGNLRLYYNVDAIHNSLRIWLASFRGEKLRMPNKGGLVIRHLFKTMSDESALALSLAIREGLKTDFSPSIIASDVSVIPDYENSWYNITVKGYCPAFRTDISYEDKMRKL